MVSVKIFFHETQRSYQPKLEFLRGNKVGPPSEPSNRIDDILSNLKKQSVVTQLKSPTLLDENILAKTHDPRYIEFLGSIRDEMPEDIKETAPIGFNYPLGRYTGTQDFHGKLGQFLFDPSTPITRDVFDSARASASSAYAVADTLLHGHGLAIALTRPPGHHTMYAVGGGYCFINNIAVAANRMKDKGKSVAILDLDFHHGNGTQEIFYKTDSVLYTSLHGSPEYFYPYYWGGKDERGEDDGVGFNHNYPLPKQTGDQLYGETLISALKVIDDYNPDYFLISMGLDAYHKDPVGGMQLSLEFYREMGEKIRKTSLPMGIILEGGYSDDTGLCFANFIRGLISG